MTTQESEGANTVTLTLINAQSGTDQFVAHRDGCADIKKELRFAGRFVEATGIENLETYMQTEYGFEAGYGDQPGAGWHASDVNVKPCAR